MLKSINKCDVNHSLYIRFYSLYVHLVKHWALLLYWFYKRGCPKGFVEKEMGKIKFSGYTKRNKGEKKGVPFVITYHPSLKNIGRIINQNLCILYASEDIKSVFTPASVISFCSARKLRSYLVRAKLYPLERTAGSVQCRGKRCQTCHNDFYQHNLRQDF